jgi:acetate---CoA ligase (ADP-forming)
LKAGIVPIGGLSVAQKVLANCLSCKVEDDWLPLPRRSLPSPKMLDEAQSKQMLAKAGVTVPNGVVGTADTITRKAIPLIAPLALKGLGFAHKSEAGAVKLNLFQSDIPAAVAIIPAQNYLAEEMVQDSIVELLIGVRSDEIYGATLTIGFGGVEAELLKDTATLVLPVTASDVKTALLSLRLAPLLTGYRGKPMADLDAAVAAALAMAQLCQTDDNIAEIEVNPLMVRAIGQGAVAADAVIWRST